MTTGKLNNGIANLGKLKAANMMAAKDELRQAEIKLKEFEQLANKTQNAMDVSEYGTEKYKELENTFKMCDINIGILNETIAEYTAMMIENGEL